MNIATFSPALVLLFVCALLWILMGVRLEELTRRQKIVTITVVLILAVGNHLLRDTLGSAAYGKFLPLTMHIPYFLLFLYLTRCGIIKMTFMILSAVVFTSPTIIVGNQIKRIFAGLPLGLLLANLFTYALILLAAHFIFRGGFNYLIRYGNNSSFLRFSLVPLLYYIYLFAVMNIDFSLMDGFRWSVVRILPTVYVFVFYFLLLQSYKDLDEKRSLEAIQSALSQELDAAERQITLLNENRFKTAAYQHDMRHHLAAIDGLLSAERFDQAREYVKTVQADVASITLKRFCEHELVNLLCSSFATRAEHEGTRLSVHAKLPKELAISDTELCSLLSNALENALNAAAQLPEADRRVEFYCEHAMNKLLIEVKNPHTGKVVMRDGLPVTNREGHGHGCRVIQSIAELHRGLCSFEANRGQFVLRVVIPLS